MRAIMVLFDSLNRRMLSSYGCGWTHTPNFRRLSERTVTFENCYAGSLPCIPARRELHTGRYNFLHRSWGPLEPFDDSAVEILSGHGIYTHLVSDHQHYWEDGGATYHQRYDSWEIVRGQEGDHWKAAVRPLPEPEHYGRFSQQDELNRTYFKEESQQPQGQVFQLGLDFLEKNFENDNWFVQIESFDPHEPFFTQEKYKALYPHEYTGPRFDWPEYSKVTEPKGAVEHCRLEYAALLSMCDENLGRVLDFMDRHDMWKDTMLIVNTDHGFLLGEHDLWAKCVHPFYDEVAHIPLFVWDPRLKQVDVRRGALTQTIDIPATLLDYFGCDIPENMQGRPLRGVMENNEKIRDCALFGMHGAQVNITDGRYVYMRDYVQNNRPLFNYTLMPTHMRSLFSLEELRTMQRCDGFTFTKGCPVMKIAGGYTGNNDITAERFGSRLYDLANDPGQTRPISNPEVEDRLIRQMVAVMLDNDCPHEQFRRLGLESYLEKAEGGDASCAR